MSDNARYKHHSTYGDQCAHCVEEEVRDDLEDELSTLRTLTETQARELADVTKTRDDAREDVKSFYDKLQAADEQLAAVTRERDAANDELATIRANAERLTSYVGMSAEVETLRSALYSVTKERDALLVRIAELEADVAKSKAIINVDRTGLAKALVDIKKTIEGWAWIPAGESASYTYEDDAEEWLRREFGTAIETVSNLAIEALRDSGKIADMAFEDPLFPRPPSALAVTKAQLAELARLAKALVEALPKCTHGHADVHGTSLLACDEVATRAFRRGEDRYCDDCAACSAPNMPEYPRAAPLRALQAKLASLDGAAGGEASADEKGGGG